MGHRSCGKTTLLEALAHAAQVVRSPGTVDEGTTLLDHAPASRRFHMTTQLATLWLEWSGRTVQLLDTPGAESLAAMRDLALHSVEAAVLCLDASAGVEVGTEEAATVLRALSLPTLAVVTRADRGCAPDLLESLGAALGTRAVALQRPLFDGGALVGLLDVPNRRVLRYHLGAYSPEPVPEALRVELERAWEALAEAVAVTDDALLEHYLEYLELPPHLLREGLHHAIRTRAVAPVLFTAAAQGIGADPVLDAIAEWVPRLEDVPREVVDHDGVRERLDPAGGFVARVLAEQVDADGDRFHLLRILAGRPPSGDWFTGRTGDRHRVRKLYRLRGPRRAAAHDVGPGAIVGTWDPMDVAAGDTLTDGARTELAGFVPPAPMVAWSVAPERPADRARVDAALLAACRADPGLALHTDTLTGAVLLAGADEGHLRVALEGVRESGLAVEVGLPPVGYVETPRAPVTGVEGVHLKTGADGLVAEYGRCEVALGPADPLDGNVFVDGIGDEEEDLPLRYRPAIDLGAREAMRHGPTAGYPVVGVELVLTGGGYDLLQSTEEHFRMAGQRAVRTALDRVGTRVLEPWWEIEVVGPARTLGDVLADISGHRGRVLSTEVDGDTSVVVAHCPFRELRTFGARLRSLSHGRARFRSRESHFEPVPQQLVDEVVAGSPHGRGARRTSDAVR